MTYNSASHDNDVTSLGGAEDSGQVGDGVRAKTHASDATYAPSYRAMPGSAWPSGSKTAHSSKYSQVNTTITASGASAGATSDVPSYIAGQEVAYSLDDLVLAEEDEEAHYLAADPPPDAQHVATSVVTPTATAIPGELDAVDVGYRDATKATPVSKDVDEPASGLMTGEAILYALADMPSASSGSDDDGGTYANVVDFATARSRTASVGRTSTASTVHRDLSVVTSSYVPTIWTDGPAPDEDEAARERYVADESSFVSNDALAASDPEMGAAVEALHERRNRRASRRRAYAFMALAAVAVVGLSLLVNGLLAVDAAAEIVPETATVAREDFVADVKAYGSLKPLSDTPVTAEVAGVVDEVYVAEGDAVAEGDLLFSVRNDALDVAVEDAKKRLNDANDAITRANEAVSAAYAAYNSAVDAYYAGETDTFDEQRLNAAIESAESARVTAVDAATRAKSALESAYAESAKRYVVSPLSGIVAALSASPGASVGAGEGASVHVADISSMKVTVQVDEEDVSSVAVGQRARLTFPSLPGVTTEGTVETVASNAISTVRNGGAYGGAGRRYAVTLALSQPDETLLPGDEAEVAIITREVPDALVIPWAAVSSDANGASTVQLVTDEATYATITREVELGAHDRREAVVRSGLEEGDVVVLPAKDEDAD